MSLENTSSTQNEASKQAEPNTANYYFGEFVFYSASDEVCHIETGHKEKLEPQVAELLNLFVAQQGEVLSKEMLQTHLWPHTIVEQNSLYQLLTKLRRILKDSTRQPTYIKTLPKKGYCFIAPVRKEVPSATPKVATKENATTSSFWRTYWWALSLPVLIICFSAVAIFQRDKDSYPTPNYQLHDVSYELGLEFDVDAHRSQDLLAYIKDIFTLQVSDKQGKVIFSQRFDHRVAHPAWHEQHKLIAYWRYIGDVCELHIVSPQGAKSHQAPDVKCEFAYKPVWKSSDELILTVRQDNHLIPYLYRIGTAELVKLPLPRQHQDQFKGALKAWNDEVFYLVTHGDYSTSLININGNEVMRWNYPIWLANFNPKTGAIITNDESQRSALIATHLDGQQYTVFATAQGIFTSLAVDNKGDIYTAIETWQVNIRDKDNLPIFSTSSIDYLPVSNTLGETAFMSRRSGVCEVYLHSDGKVIQLSQHKGYEYVDFLEWRPDLSMLLSNRDLDLVIYDRQNTLLQFRTDAEEALQNIGWYNDNTIFAFDGSKLMLYNMQGKLIASHAVSANTVYFNSQSQTWLVRKNEYLYQLNELDFSQLDTLEPLQVLAPEQINLMHNLRIRNNTLYWQSSWSKQDLIWAQPLEKGAPTELVKKGNLIWHFDITPYQELTIAKMEAIEGDIKRLSEQQ